MVRSEKPRRLLCHVINFVRHASRRDEKREPLRIGRAQSRAQSRIYFVPRYAFEPSLAFASNKRIRQSSELTQPGVLEFLQPTDIFEPRRIERPDGIEPQKI
jgi:hypothetical protein